MIDVLGAFIGGILAGSGGLMVLGLCVMRHSQRHTARATRSSLADLSLYTTPGDDQ